MTTAPVALSLGQLGSIYVADTSAHGSASSDSNKGPFGVIQALADTVIASITSSTLKNPDGTAVTALAVPSGICIFGQITAFTLTSGKVIAYNMSVV